jgi:ketopantoate hydroxymethyltransferase
MLGMTLGHRPKFAKAYANLGDQIRSAAESYVSEVRAGSFPGPDHCYKKATKDAAEQPAPLESRTKLAVV